MSLSLKITLFLSIASLLTTVTTVHAHEKVNNMYFSLKVPHAWRYTEYSNTKMASIFGIGPANQVILAPSQIGNDIFNNNKDDAMIYTKINDSGAFSQFTQDADYDKKASFATYLEYLENKYPNLTIVSQTDSIVDKEKAIRLEGHDNSNIIKLLIYVILHDNMAYNLDYVSNVKDYDKYLSDFKEMVKSFRFEN